MRHALLFLIATSVTGQTQVYDANGKPVILPSVQETRKRKMIEDGPGGKVFEEFVERRDASGNPMPPEKLRVVERTGPDGANVIETTVFRGDLNGRLSAAERSTISTLQTGDQTKSVSTTEKPNGNGGFTVIEKAASESTTTGSQQITNRSVYIPDVNGRFVEAVREQKQRAPEGGGFKEVTQEYRNASTGKMELSGQKVSVEMRNPDGSTTSEITIYGMAAPGRPADGQLSVREQQLVIQKPGPNGTVVESLSIRRPNLSDEKLGAYQKISEKVMPAPAAAKTP